MGRSAGRSTGRLFIGRSGGRRPISGCRRSKLGSGAWARTRWSLTSRLPVSPLFMNSRASLVCPLLVLRGIPASLGARSRLSALGACPWLLWTLLGNAMTSGGRLGRPGGPSGRPDCLEGSARLNGGVAAGEDGPEVMNGTVLGTGPRAGRGGTGAPPGTGPGRRRLLLSLGASLGKMGIFG